MDLMLSANIRGWKVSSFEKKSARQGPSLGNQNEPELDSDQIKKGINLSLVPLPPFSVSPSLWCDNLSFQMFNFFLLSSPFTISNPSF